MSAKAFQLGIPSQKTLIVEGAYGHVNFLYHPEPIFLDVIDLIPPEPSRLYDLVYQSLTLNNNGPIVLQKKFIDIEALGKNVKAETLLYPCAVSGMKTGKATYFLDEHPEKQDWVLMGCERTEEIYHHMYKESPQRHDTCPKNLMIQSEGYSITRCCSWQTHYEIQGKTAFVPWGADLPMMGLAIAELFKTRN
jgi:hypothetical protein